MDIKEQICSLTQSQQLVSLGIEGDESLFVYVLFGIEKTSWIICLRQEVNSFQMEPIEVLPAFTVAELGKMLCHKIRLNKMNYTFRANLEKSGLWHLKYRTLSEEGKMIPLAQCQNVFEAEARAELLIKMIEKKYLTPNLVNKKYKEIV